VTFSRNELCNGAEKIDTNLVMVLESAEEAGDGRKSSPEVRRSFRFRNFGFRSRKIGVTARETSRTSGFSVSRAMPAYI